VTGSESRASERAGVAAGGRACELGLELLLLAAFAAAQMLLGALRPQEGEAPTALGPSQPRQPSRAKPRRARATAPRPANRC